MKNVEWDEVESFFRDYGCPVVGHPELGWYQESWHALERADLVRNYQSDEFNISDAVPKLRAICLLAMYLGIYQVAEGTDLGGYFSEHPPISWCLDSLNVEMEQIWNLARHEGVIDTKITNYMEDEGLDNEQLSEIAIELVSYETDSIFDSLKKHYGDQIGLFVSIWNSRFPSGHKESPQDVINSVYGGDGKVEIWSYIEGGMSEWWWS